MELLNSKQLVEDVNGGVNWGAVGAGIGAVGLGVAIAATGGLATVPIGVIMGAGTAGEIITAGAAAGAAAGGGSAIGWGLGH